MVIRILLLALVSSCTRELTTEPRRLRVHTVLAVGEPCSRSRIACTDDGELLKCIEKEWFLLKDCAARNEVCVESEAGADCAAPCQSGQRDCQGSAVTQCVDGMWETGEDCALSGKECVDGACKAAVDIGTECDRPGRTACNDGAIVECMGGEWVVSEWCPSGSVCREENLTARCEEECPGLGIDPDTMSVFYDAELVGAYMVNLFNADTEAFLVLQHGDDVSDTEAVSAAGPVVLFAGTRLGVTHVATEGTVHINPYAAVGANYGTFSYIGVVWQAATLTEEGTLRLLESSPPVCEPELSMSSTYTVSRYPCSLFGLSEGDSVCTVDATLVATCEYDSGPFGDLLTVGDDCAARRERCEVTESGAVCQ
jgi:hypothetical protein